MRTLRKMQSGTQTYCIHNNTQKAGLQNDFFGGGKQQIVFVLSKKIPSHCNFNCRPKPNQ